MRGDRKSGEIRNEVMAREDAGERGGLSEGITEAERDCDVDAGCPRPRASSRLGEETVLRETRERWSD